MINISIRMKLAMFIIIVFIPLMTLQATSIKNRYHDRIEIEMKGNEILAQAISTSFINYIEEIWTQQISMGTVFTAPPYMTLFNMKNYLNELTSKDDSILGHSLLHPDGTLWVTSLEAKEMMLGITGESFIKEILRGKTKTISNLHFYSGNPILSVAYGTRRYNDLSGIIVTHIDINNLEKRLPRLPDDKQIDYMLIDQNGMLVYHSEFSHLPEEVRQLEETSPAWRALKEKVVVKTYKRQSSFDGSFIMEIDYPIPGIGWSCTVTTSLDLLQDQLKQQVVKEIVLLLAIALGSLLLAIILGTHILKPLIVLQSMVGRLKERDYSVRTNIKGSNEIALVAQTVDSLAASIDEYDKMKTQSFINLSHELRTPLNIILGCVQLIDKVDIKSDSDPLDEILRYNRMMKQNCYRLLRLINNLMDLSRYDAGFLVLNLTKHNIVRIIEDITLSVVELAKLKDISIIFDTDIEEKMMVFDPDKIERVMLNLLSNAIKFTPPNGNVCVSITDGEEYLTISVKDTGLGVPKEKQDLIFDRFKQVNAKEYIKNEGSGIGLSLVKLLVEAHHGVISLNSELGKGSEFIIALPVDLQENGEGTDRTQQARNWESLVEMTQIEFSDVYNCWE